MNQFRAGLTRLKTLISERLPDTPDVYGYPGISKASLLSTLDDVYALSGEIQDDNRFEIISLKRTGSELYRRLKEFLEEDTSSENAKSAFNTFLDGFAQLVEKTRMTYFIVVKHGIRDDEELASIRMATAVLIQSSGELKKQHDTLIGLSDEVNASVTAIQAAHDNSDKQTAVISQWHEKAVQSGAKIEQIRKTVEGLDESIEENERSIKDLSERAKKLEGEATTAKDRLENLLQQTSVTAKGLETSGKQHAELLEKINLALEDANRIGMAASFKTRKDELRYQQAAWQVTFIGALACIVGAVWKIIIPTVNTLQNNSDSWTRLIAELGIVSPLIWLGWFAARQYSFTSRIREDYAFKSAAAMAYEGHKKAARETDESLEKVLLEFSLFNMAQNPIRLYGDGDVYGTPAHEASSRVAKQLKRLTKIIAESPTLGRLEISADKDEK